MGLQNLKAKGKSFIDKHGEIWKFVKWTVFTGVGASGVELIVFMLLLNFAFASSDPVPITNAVLNYVGVKYAAYMYSYLISTTVGYSIAFVLNRKLTFKADSNPVISAFFAILLVIFNIFACTWIGSALSNVSIAYQWGSMGDLITKIVVMAIPSIWTYPANRFIIHRIKKQPTAPGKIA